MTSDDAQTWFEKGGEALHLSIGADYSEDRRGYLSEAIAAFGEATLRAPEHLEAWNLLGRALAALAHDGTTPSRERPDLLSQAVAAFDQVTRLRPDDAQAWFEKAEALHHIGRDAEAVGACDEVLRREPGRHGALYLKADMLTRLGLHQEALEGWDAILQSEGAPSRDTLPFDLPFRARLQRAGALAALGRSADAHAAFAEAFAARHPGMAGSGIIDAMLGRFVEARLAYLEGTQDQAEAWRSIGHALAGAGQPADALVAFETAIVLEPDDPDAWSGKADALVACGRHEEATPAYGESSRLRRSRNRGSS